MRKITNIILVIILAGLLGWYVYSDLKSDSVDKNGNATKTLSDLGIELEGDGDAIVEQVPVEVELPKPQPVLERSITFSSSFSAEAQTIMRKKFDDVIAILKLNPGRIDAWIDLGSFRNAVSDYEGARQAWEYAALLSPSDPVIFANLGFLYGYNLKKPSKGEENFLRAIASAPKAPTYYYQTANFYLDVMISKTKALAIVKQGLKEIPNDANLLALKKRLE